MRHFIRYNQNLISTNIQLTLEKCRDKGCQSPAQPKSMYNFCLPQNITAHSLLLIRSLTNKINNQLTHVYVMYITISLKYTKENVIKKIIRKRKYYLQYCILFINTISLYCLFTRWIICQYLYQYQLTGYKNTVDIICITNTRHQKWKIIWKQIHISL